MVQLYDIYSPLLSERQREIMDLYYNEDESLSEIAENTGITRQGVRDCILKTESLLLSYENSLKLHSKYTTFKSQIDELVKEASNKNLDDDFKKKLDSLKDAFI